MSVCMEFSMCGTVVQIALKQAGRAYAERAATFVRRVRGTQTVEQQPHMDAPARIAVCTVEQTLPVSVQRCAQERILGVLACVPTHACMFACVLELSRAGTSRATRCAQSSRRTSNVGCRPTAAAGQRTKVLSP